MTRGSFKIDERGLRLAVEGRVASALATEIRDKGAGARMPGAKQRQD
jgi:hypothetical protein